MHTTTTRILAALGIISGAITAITATWALLGRPFPYPESAILHLLALSGICGIGAGIAGICERASERTSTGTGTRGGAR